MRKLICQDGLLIFEPEQLQIPNAAFVGLCLKAGDVLEQSQHHVVELGTGEPHSE